MNLYLISQDKNNGYDTFDSAIVAAVSATQAVKIHPYHSWDDVFSEERNSECWKQSYYGSWCGMPEDVDAKYIGKAAIGTKKGIILASYNAG